ncbi:hypothetical protein HHK36_025645 [Tetracentron sinense]|uniref:Protein PLANT CADMIUM RESISTANCE 8-like n=1 Tax=Tetracentron sinense TaxID=13715 RepID=A0A834YKU5_TETSI|nr:hypothetical protein HHK36_025645 [Tetracentron sinense]
MGLNQTTGDGETPQSGEPVSSVPSKFQTVENPSIGNPWTTGLFDCHEHQTNACPLGSFIYLLMMPALCSQWIMGSKYRAKLRKKYDLVDAPYEDKISHIFCPCCSLCQEFRELKSRGLDPALGWKGNLAQQQGRQYLDQQVKTPPQKQTML